MTWADIIAQLLTTIVLMLGIAVFAILMAMGSGEMK